MKLNFVIFFVVLTLLWWLFMKNCMFIGNMGCGKSTWLKALNQHGYRTIFEDLSDIVYLKDYWEKGTFAFHTQVSFYASWLNLYNKANQMGGALLDSSILSHHMVFTQHMFDDGTLDRNEYNLCCQLFNAIYNNIDCQCIYLHCDVDENIKRVSNRSRNLEKRNVDYVIEMNKRFEILAYAQRNHMLSINITALSPHSYEDFIYFCNQLIEGGINIDCYLRGNR